MNFNVFGFSTNLLIGSIFATLIVMTFTKFYVLFILIIYFLICLFQDNIINGDREVKPL